MAFLNCVVFDCIARRPGSTVKEVGSELAQIDQRSVQKAVARLRETGFLEKERDGRTFHYTIAPGAQRPVDGRGGDHRKPHAA